MNELENNNHITYPVGERHIKYYKKFREELDNIVIPQILRTLAVRDIYYKNKPVGFLCVTEQGYIDALYIEKEYRRKGLARKAVLDYYNEVSADKDVTLVIINNNFSALEFWTSIFYLECLKVTDLEKLFRIVSVKGVE